LFGTALLAGIASTSEGQSTQQSIPPVKVTIPNIHSSGETEQAVNDSTQTLRGFVYDSKTNEPVDGITVFIHINGTEFQTTSVSDTGGMFSAIIPANSEGKRLELNFVGYFYKDHKVKTTVNSQTGLKVALKRNHKKHHMRGKF
jgi:hypothetical protein